VIRSQLTTDVARVRVNYNFGGGADPATTVNQPAAMAYNWTGFYAGGNAGGGMAAFAFTDPCFYCSSASPTGGYFTGGGQAGYNYQFGRGLVGIEVDINGNSSFQNSVIGGASSAANQNAMTVGLKADVSGTIRARAGLVVNNALVYATGGAAWAKVDQTGIEFNNLSNNANFGRPTGLPPTPAARSGVAWLAPVSSLRSARTGQWAVNFCTRCIRTATPVFSTPTAPMGVAATVLPIASSAAS
jgi:hypothetical protein